MADDRLDAALTAVQTPEGQAFLDTLAGPESSGRYNVRFDGSPTGAPIADLSTHPRIAIVIPQGMPEAGRTSDAAGAYEMLSSTADAAAQRLGLPGAAEKQYSFDPLSQKLLAFDNAAKAYEPYGNLLGDLQAGNIDKVMGAMRATRQWDTANPQAYAGNLARYAQTAQSGASDAPTGRVMGAAQQDPLVGFINGTLSLPPQGGGAVPTPAPQDVPATVRATGIGPNGEFIVPQTEAQVSDPNWNVRDIPNPAIAALAAAGNGQTNAPVVNGQGAPVTRDQLAGTAPMPTPAPTPAVAPSAGIAALAAAGQPAAGVQPPGSAVPQVNSPALPPENADIQAQRAQLDQVVARKNQILNAWSSGIAPPSGKTIDLFNTLTQQEQTLRAGLPTVKAAEATATAAGSAAGGLPYEQPKALATALGTNMAQVGSGGAIQPLPGALATTQANAQAKATGEQIPVQMTQAVAPKEMRGAGASVYFPPGSPLSQQFQANKNLPDNVQVDAQGGVTIANTNPSSETIGKNFEELNKMGDTADAARQQLYQAKLLKQTLNSIGTSGPATDTLGALGAMARQAGVPKETLDAINIPPAPTIEQAKAIQLELLGATLRATFPGRITNTDITTMKPSMPGINLLNEASNYLIDNIITPKAQRDIERYGAATTLPQNDTQAFKKQLFDWDQAHPYENYVASNQAGPPQPNQSASPQGASGVSALPEGLPQGSRQIGTKDGAPVYATPDGQRFQVK